MLQRKLPPTQMGLNQRIAELGDPAKAKITKSKSFQSSININTLHDLLTQLGLDRNEECAKNANKEALVYHVEQRKKLPGQRKLMGRTMSGTSTLNGYKKFQVM